MASLDHGNNSPVMGKIYLGYAEQYSDFEIGIYYFIFYLGHTF